MVPWVSDDAWGRIALIDPDFDAPDDSALLDGRVIAGYSDSGPATWGSFGFKLTAYDAWDDVRINHNDLREKKALAKRAKGEAEAKQRKLAKGAN
jgi:hypothetical protein